MSVLGTECIYGCTYCISYTIRGIPFLQAVAFNILNRTGEYEMVGDGNGDGSGKKKSLES